MDEVTTRWFNALAGQFPLLDAVAIVVTTYGVPLMVAFVAAQWWSRTDRLHVRHTAVAAGASFFLGLAFNQLAVSLVPRVRPYDMGVTHLIIPPSVDGSFPSDHATAAFAVAAAFALDRLPARASALLAVAFLVAWSRLFVGTHYFSDVVGGACTGLLAAIVVRTFYREGSRLDRRVTELF